MFPSAPKSLISGTNSTLSRRRQALAASDRFTSASKNSSAPALFKDMCFRWKLPGSNKHLLSEDSEESPAKRRKMAPTGASAASLQDASLFLDEAPLRGLFTVFNSFEMTQSTGAVSFSAAEKAHKRSFPNAEAENRHAKGASKPLDNATSSSLASAEISPSFCSTDWSFDAYTNDFMPFNSSQPVSMDDFDWLFSPEPSYDSAAIANLALAEFDAIAYAGMYPVSQLQPAL